MAATYTTMGELDSALRAKKISVDDYLELKKGLENQGGVIRVAHGTQGKGNVSVYGFSKKGFPVTLYPDQWRRLIDEAIPKIEQFLKDEEKNLKSESFLEKHARECAAKKEAKEKSKSK